MAKIPAPKRGDFLAGINRARKEGYEKALEDVRAEVGYIDGITTIGAQILDEVIGVIDRLTGEARNERDCH